MSMPTNLNKIRKERERAARRTRADQNSVQFGQSKTQKETLKARVERIALTLEGHKRGT
ncbi:DUF4169 family protein [uncultured Sulfitobacter sp.]|uniref:DUF4169 family protein n=1 Tax=uncultured Sulfitobacter sp. TaxID=191468 RepID=UPI002605FBF8|nr:DUF4169 family protein [uncultured Sulfitobacter sp.]